MEKKKTLTKSQETVKVPPKVTKIIAKDIWLEKEPEANGFDVFYKFIIVTKTVKIVNFEADFTGSDKVSFFSEENDPQPLVLHEPIKATINPVIDDNYRICEVRKFLVRVRLDKNNWKLKSKFRFTFSNLPKEKQREIIKVEVDALNRSIKQFEADFCKETYMPPFEKMPQKILEESLSKPGAKGKQKFVDLNFPPKKQSIFELTVDSPFDIYIHWRRPLEFSTVDYKQDLHQPAVFYNSIEPSDIRPGLLGDDWFLSALAILAERPALIERLFLTRQINDQGCYRVKLCKNGEWQVVTVDDYFPCYPKGEPIFGKCKSNDLWVMILEKAYAKLHGGYFQLRGGFVNEALIDLTGCPSISYDLEDEYVRHFIGNGQFWELILYFYSEGYLLSFSSDNEQRWLSRALQKEQESKDGKTSETQDPHKTLKSIHQQRKESIPKGQAFTVVFAKEALGKQLICLRSPFQIFKWEGDWRIDPENKNWDMKTKAALGNEFFAAQSEENEMNGTGMNEDMTFWMSYLEAVSYFKSLNVCRVQNWNEIRIKGKFLRVQDIDQPSIEVVLSKWYYQVDIKDQPARIFIGLHQEDERIKGVLLRRPYMDVSLAVLKCTTEGVELVDLKDFMQDRQCEIEVNLEPGSYIVLPRTTGCTLRRPDDAKRSQEKKAIVKLLVPQGSSDGMQKSAMTTDKKQLSTLFEITVNDIFRKFDMLLTRELGYLEFKGFYECIGKDITEEEFDRLLDLYSSTKVIVQEQLSQSKQSNSTKNKGGLTLEGFKRFLLKQTEDLGETVMFQWLENLGYDQELYPIRSRCFMMTFHSSSELTTTVRDAIQTDLDTRTNLLILDKFGQDLEQEKNYRIMYTFSEQVLAYSYAVQNLSNKPLDILLDFSKSENMLYSSLENRIKKMVMPGQIEFMMHTMAKPNSAKFSRSVNCQVNEYKKQI